MIADRYGIALRTAVSALKAHRNELVAVKARILELCRSRDRENRTLWRFDRGLHRPMQHWLERVVISSGSGPILASVGAETTVQHPGESRMLESTCRRFRCPEDAESWHNHLEFYSGNHGCRVNHHY